jgi:hypothetical protein
MKKLLLTIVIFIVLDTVQAQSIERKVINAMGTTYHTTALTLKTSVGEPIVGRRGSGMGLSQGFFTSHNATKTATAVSDLSGDIKVTISPNPAKDMIYTVGPANESLSVQILNMLGQTVVERSAITGAHSVAELASGMYIVQIYDQNNLLVQSSRIIKQ